MENKKDSTAKAKMAVKKAAAKKPESKKTETKQPEVKSDVKQTVIVPPKAVGSMVESGLICELPIYLL